MNNPRLNHLWAGLLFGLTALAPGRILGQNAGQPQIPAPEAPTIATHVASGSSVPAPAVLKAEDYKHYADYFNGMEDENIVQAIPNAESWDWMKQNIPLFECPQDNFEEIYYYRWWSLRKHIRETPQGYAMTEFLVDRTYSDKYNMIACALGHHIYEARWLHNPDYLDQYVHLWYRGNDGEPMSKLHGFSSWTANALYNRYLVDKDTDFLVDMLPDLVNEFKWYEAEKQQPGGLFWQFDVRDGMEESISGDRHEKNARPTINSYMYGNAQAISAIADLAGQEALVDEYSNKAEDIKKLIINNLWNDESLFFETRKENGEWAKVREAIGYIPWYFNIPGPQHAAAWKQVADPAGFLAPYGLTTAERRHPEFRMNGCCNCEWDGAIWPFASAQTLTALANFMESGEQTTLPDSLYFRLLELYVESQYHRGRPYIGEYLDETTGYWLKGDQERSRYYNHSTFNDLIITGLVGLRPQEDDTVVLNPLIPEDKWDWFCLDNVLYHGKVVTVLWDRTGEKYGRGKGFQLLVNGKKIAGSERLEPIKGVL